MAGSEGFRWLGDPDVFHGEGAYWDDHAGVLRYVDMLAGDVITLDGTVTRRTHIGDVVALIRRRLGGGFVAALERGFALLDDDLRIESVIPVFDDAALRMNEGACDAQGRLFCGSMAYDLRPGGGTLYRLDTDGRVTTALSAVTIPNGLLWIDEGRTALHADTAAREIRAYEYAPEAGTFGAATTFVRVPQGHGSPDGMTLDADGGVWVAMWGGGRVHRYAADGRLDEVINLPVSNPTSCAFGGPAGSTLHVTTSRQYIDPGAEPLAGLVCVVETSVHGAAVLPFGG